MSKTVTWTPSQFCSIWQEQPALSTILFSGYEGPLLRLACKLQRRKSACAIPSSLAASTLLAKEDLSNVHERQGQSLAYAPGTNHSLKVGLFSLIRPKKFPVPASREFSGKLLENDVDLALIWPVGACFM
jgi:hypothetical protein